MGEFRDFGRVDTSQTVISEEVRVPSSGVLYLSAQLFNGAGGEAGDTVNKIPLGKFFVQYSRDGVRWTPGSTLRRDDGSVLSNPTDDMSPWYAMTRVDAPPGAFVRFGWWNEGGTFGFVDFGAWL